jgi:hypothetical protein
MIALLKNITMTPKEELIQAIERSPDDLVRAILALLKVMQRQSSEKMSPEQQPALAESSDRLFRKQGVLVIKGEPLNGFDTNAFITEVREERIQSQIGQADS